MAQGLLFGEVKSCFRCGKMFARNRKYSAVQWATARACSHQCGTWNLGVTKDDDPRMARVAECVRISAKGRPSWSKGLTKYDHPSLAIVAQKVSVKQKGKKINDAQRRGLESGRVWFKGRTKETCAIIKRRAAKLSKKMKGVPQPEHSERLRALYAIHPEKHPNAILAKKTKGRGFTHIEKLVAKDLTALGITFDYNKRIGRKWPDFSIPSHRLIIEADGEHWHQDKEKEAERDAHLTSLGWAILHLPGKLIVNDPSECRRWIRNALEWSLAAR
jgi:very-short-patch-repair endonuclease